MRLCGAFCANYPKGAFETEFASVELFKTTFYRVMFEVGL